MAPQSTHQLVPWGYCLSMDLGACSPRILRSKEKIEEFVTKLCDEVLKVQRYGPFWIERFGAKTEIEGYSSAAFNVKAQQSGSVQMIEVSSIVGHYSEAFESCFIDIFSCMPFEQDLVLSFTKQAFKAQFISCKYWERFAWKRRDTQPEDLSSDEDSLNLPQTD